MQLGTGINGIKVALVGVALACSGLVKAQGIHDTLDSLRKAGALKDPPPPELIKDVLSVGWDIMYNSPAGMEQKRLRSVSLSGQTRFPFWILRGRVSGHPGMGLRFQNLHTNLNDWNRDLNSPGNLMPDSADYNKNKLWSAWLELPAEMGYTFKGKRPLRVFFGGTLAVHLNSRQKHKNDAQKVVEPMENVEDYILEGHMRVGFGAFALQFSRTLTPIYTSAEYNAIGWTRIALCAQLSK